MAKSNRVNFTAPKVEKASCTPGKEQSFLWDSGAPGLGLRITKAGSKSYIFESRVLGRTLRVTIGSVRSWGLGDAQAEARRLQMLCDSGIDPRKHKAEQAAEAEAKHQQAKHKSMPVNVVWLVYLQHHQNRWGARHLADHINLSQAGGQPKKRGKGVTVQGVLYPLLQRRMGEISASILTEWQVGEAATRANNARQGFELFRAFWRWCASRPEYVTIIDAQAVEGKDLRAEVPSRKSKRFDVLECAQLATWFGAVRGLSNPVISTYLQALLLTGARRDEMAELRWEDVDFRWGCFWIKDKVAEEGRKIPLSPYLASLLQALPRRNEWVFSSPTSANGHITEPRISHNRALAVAGLDHVTLHGLRRTFASLAEWVEMPRGIVAQIMGHAPNATAEKHYIVRPIGLLARWHSKYEAWILEQAGIEFEPTQLRSTLRVISAT